MKVRNRNIQVVAGNSHIKKSLIVGLVVGLTLVNSQKAFAVGSAGFENASLSTSSLARANASVANAEDASTMAFNPAGLSKLEGNELYIGNSMIHSATKYKAIEGRNDEDSSETATPVPFFYMTSQTDIDGLVWGFGANSPFGLSTKYSSTGNFEFSAYFTELKSLSYNLSVGYEVNPWLSIGVGGTYMELRLKQNGKFNSPHLVVTDPAPSPFELDVTGHGFGYNLGALIMPTPEHTIGLFYRSQVQARLQGNLATDELGPAMRATFNTNGSTSHITSADTDYKLPANITVGYKYQPSEKWDVEVDVGWTDWSSYDSFDLAYADSNAILAGFEQFSKDYTDSWSVHLGGTYNLNEDWSVSAGYFFYERAANKNTYKNENPDGNRHGIGAGFEHRTPGWTWDLMYIAELISEEDIENVEGGTNGADLDGRYQTFIQLVTTGLRYAF